MRMTEFLGGRAAFRAIAACAIAACASTAALAQTPAARYAGIEVGAKGVKAIVVEVAPSGAKTNVMEGVANTTLAQGVAKAGAFSQGAIDDTAEEAGKFARRIRDEFHVPADKVVVIGSSGLPAASNRDALVKAVAEATGFAPMTFITPSEEVRYTILGLLEDEADRAGALLVDVGSGNTKGGFLKGAEVVDFSIPFGSVTFENRVAADVTKDGKSFAEVADGLRASVLEDAIAGQMTAHPELSGRKIVVLSGGAAYAMATLLRPRDAGLKRIDLTAKDVADYATLVRKSPITSPELDAAKGTEVDKDVKKVFDTFTPTNLIAGSEILTALSAKLPFEGKTLRFDRTGVMALIRGKVIEQAEQAIPPPTPQSDRALKPGPADPVDGKDAGPFHTPKAPSKILPEAIPPVAA